MRKIYFYPDIYYPAESYHSYDKVEEVAYHSDKEEIHTTDMAHLSFDLLDAGFEIYVTWHGITKQFYPGMENAHNKDIRKSHNLLRLWMGHFFDDDFKPKS